MLLIFLYDSIFSGKQEPEIVAEKFEKHLIYLQEKFNIILPGQPILKNKISISLILGNPYKETYNYIFPILKKLNIPIILGIPPGLIGSSLNTTSSEKLSNEQPSSSLFCNWKEIRSMIHSGLLYPASYSLNQKNLNHLVPDQIYQEICRSKRIVSTQLENVVETFIYPFKSYTKRIYEITKNHYKYVMCLGNARNNNWEQQLLYLIQADNIWQQGKNDCKLNYLLWNFNYYLNKITPKFGFCIS